MQGTICTPHSIVEAIEAKQGILLGIHNWETGSFKDVRTLGKADRLQDNDYAPRTEPPVTCHACPIRPLLTPKTEAQRCEGARPSLHGLQVRLADTQSWATEAQAAWEDGPWVSVGDRCKLGGTHLLDKVHEAAAKAPGLVPMALQ